jgi:2-haloacid dehalogenase
MEHFLTTVCTPSWNSQQDAGRSFAEACASLKLEHPSDAALIDAWIERQEEMILGRSTAPLKSSRNCVLAEFVSMP